MTRSQNRSRKMDNYTKLDDDSDIECGKTKTKEDTIDDVCSPHPTKWWEAIRTVVLWMLFTSALFLAVWALMYIYIIIKDCPKKKTYLEHVTKLIKCALCSTLYFLIILANDVKRVCRIVVRETCRHRVCITKFICVLFAIVSSLTLLIFTIFIQL
jgi:hypothetical protein